MIQIHIADNAERQRQIAKVHMRMTVELLTDSDASVEAIMQD
jgi:hypothetical protein